MESANSIIHDSQNGFGKGRGTKDQVLSLKSLIDTRKLKGQSTFAAFIAIATDSGLSKFAHVASTVPQGSISGLTLFLLFINDLPLFLNHCCANLFADDASFHTHNDTVDVNEYHLMADF